MMNIYLRTYIYRCLGFHNQSQYKFPQNYIYIYIYIYTYKLIKINIINEKNIYIIYINDLEESCFLLFLLLLFILYYY